MYRLLARAVGAAGFVVQYACITHCAFEYVGDFVVCSGPSMEPTLSTNNVLLTEKITTRTHKVRRGDIIIACCPTDPRNQICKRVVGLPGDRVLVGNLNSNVKLKDIPSPISKNVRNSIYDSDHSKAASHREKEEVTIPRGHIWIEGDNASNSADSRFYGPVPLGLVKSRAICRVWPLSEISLLI